MKSMVEGDRGWVAGALAKEEGDSQSLMINKEGVIGESRGELTTRVICWSGKI